ncbi:MAG: LpqB family beta-propeller domain-containing protein [Leucobacter sp.]
MTRAAFRIVAILTLGVLVLTGCQAIPDSGPVSAGLSDLRQAERQVLYNPGGPVEGSTQEEIVSGFVQAASSSDDDYAIARQFLTPGYSSQWDPFAGVFIDEGSRPFRADGDNVGVLSLSARATVDVNGALAPVKPGPTTDVRFELEEVGGEWRIASAPTGIILDLPTFAAVWSSHQLFFVGADGNLVPDTRWFLSGPTLATEIMSELFAGPEEYMRDVIRTGFPSGTALVANSVPTTDGVARIDLTGAPIAADSEVIALINKQIAASLQSVPGITKYELYVDGSRVESGPVGRSDSRPIGTEPQPAYVIEDGEFGVATGNGADPLPGLGAAIVAQDPDAVALSRELNGAAVRTSEGTSWVTEDEVVGIDSRPNQVHPGIDLFGYVWTLSRESPELLLATLPGQDSVQLDLGWLDGDVPTAVRISPDGSRVAALVGDDQESEVRVAGIVRNAQGEPTGMTETATSQLWVTGEPLDLDWIDEMGFAALTQVGNAGKVTMSGPGLFETESGSVPGGTGLSGDGSRLMLRVLGEGQNLFAPQGVGWQRQDAHADVLAKFG